MKKLLKIEDIMDLFGISRPTAYLRIRAKGFPGFKLGGIWRFDEELVRKWIEKENQAS